MNNEDKFQIKEIEPKMPLGQVKPPKERGPSLPRKYKLFKILKVLIVIVIIAAIGIAVGAVFWGRYSFSRAKVQIDIETPEDIASGEEVVLTIVYKNNNPVNLNDAYLIIDYPSGTFSSGGKEIYQEQRNLETISRKSQGKEEFKVRFIGQEGTAKNLAVKLNYQPQNITSRFENSFSSRIEINSVLIGINIEGPEKSVAGHEANYFIKYENKTDDDISNLKMELVYSDDFEFKNADPSPEPVEENNVWQINLLRPGESQMINLMGILKGEEGEDKVLTSTIGKIENDIFLQYSQIEYITKIAPSPVEVSLKIKKMEEECHINPGQELNYEIEFKNNTDVALGELILKLYFQDNIFDFQTLTLGNVGFFDSRKNVIIWSGAEIPALVLLEPGQIDKVNFSIKIKESLPIFTYNDKNFQASVLAEIETLTVPAKFSVPKLSFEQELTCKINTELSLKAKVYYYEPGPGILNTGPIPPRVDYLTTYTVHWQITNTSNDLENVRVTTTLPQGITWSDYYINKVAGSQLYYNERTKEVVWEIDKVPATAGVVLSIYELVFQIGLRPSINQVGERPILINESLVEGKDKFTGIILEDSSPIVNTSLPDDPKTSVYEGRVRE
jgi:hypothetical protein